MNQYMHALDNAKRDKARKQAEYEANKDSLYEAIINYFVDEIIYSPQTGRLIIWNSCKLLVRMLKADTVLRTTEQVALHNLVTSALLAHPVQELHEAIEPDNIIRYPRQMRLQMDRFCAVCSSPTPDGTKELCGGCHEQYRIQERYDTRVLSEWMLDRMIAASNREWRKTA